MEKRNLEFLFILSGMAGGGTSLTFHSEIERIFEEAGMKDRLHILETEYKNHPYDAAKSFAEKYGERAVIYASGGDGTLNEVATALAGSKAAMGIIPAGTANDFARVLYGTRPLPSSVILKKTPYPVMRHLDIVKMKFTEMDGTERELCGLNVTSFGLDTLILKKTYKILRVFPKLKGTAYFVATASSLFTKKHFPVGYELTLKNGEKVRSKQNLALSAIGNGAYYGNGFNPTPGAHPADGVLKVCLVNKMGTLRFIRLAKLYHDGEHSNEKEVKIYDVEKGSFESLDKNPIVGNYDGTIFEVKKFEFEIVPNAIRFACLWDF